jgi:hypothetical protein
VLQTRHRPSPARPRPGAPGMSRHTPRSPASFGGCTSTTRSLARARGGRPPPRPTSRACAPSTCTRPPGDR